MDSEQTTEGEAIDTTNDDGDGETGSDTIAIPKADYEKMNQTLGSLKRELKDLKKPKEEPQETQQTKPEEFGLLHKSYLRSAGITDPEDVELARELSKKWGVEIDALVDDEDFKIKLERQQTKRSNELATSNIRGTQGTTQAKNSPDFWIAKGIPPTPDDVPDRKTRATIVKAMIKNASSSGKQFYND